MNSRVDRALGLQVAVEIAVLTDGTIESDPNLTQFIRPLRNVALRFFGVQAAFAAQVEQYLHVSQCSAMAAGNFSYEGLAQRAFMK